MTREIMFSFSDKFYKSSYVNVIFLIMSFGIVFKFVVYPYYSFASTYRLTGYSKFYSRYILDLPEYDDTFFNTRKLDNDGWTPGESALLTDIKELQAKIPKHVTTSSHHEILYFYPRPKFMLSDDNKMLNTCPYKNCHITDDWSKYPKSSAVIFYISYYPMKAPPPNRPRDQIWLFHDYEPPCINGKVDHRHKTWDDKFNWSMTFRLDSDVIRNYGYLRSREPEEVPNVDYHEVFSRKKKFAAWIASNCGSSRSMSERNEYIKQLRKYFPIDVYGKCGIALDRADENVTKILSDYKFYLSFENSFCADYVTEKFFRYFNLSDAIMIVRGGAKYDRLLPAYTYINAQHFSSARDLALYLLSLSKNEHEYTKYLQTRDKYQVEMMNWACNLCIKLNNKQKYAKTYNDIVTWWHKDQCWAADDIRVSWSVKRHWTSIVLVLLCVLFVGVIYRHCTSKRI